MNKGAMSIGAVVMLVVGVVAAALIVGGVLSPTTEQYGEKSAQGADNASGETDYAICVANCREENPGDRSEFLNCRENNNCPPR